MQSSLIAIWCRLRSILIRIYTNIQNGTQNWHVSNHRDTFAQFSSMDDFLMLLFYTTILQTKNDIYLVDFTFHGFFLEKRVSMTVTWLSQGPPKGPKWEKKTLDPWQFSNVGIYTLSQWMNLGINYWPWSDELYAILSFNQTVWLVAYKWAIIPPPYHKSLPNHTHI